jgi:AraC-like DNA-binding protein
MIMFVHSGSGSIVAQEQNYPLTPGCLCVVGSSRFYYTLPDCPDKYDRSKVFLSNAELDRVLELFPDVLQVKERFAPNSLVYAQVPPSAVRQIDAIFDDLALYEDRGYYHDALVTSHYIKLLILLHEYATNTVFPVFGMVQKATEYINAHIYEHLSIDEICSVLHVSKYYFCKKFKQSTGLTVMDYILMTRIISAKNMLENSDLAIGEISSRCGFSSQSYFCRVFKDETGMTPLQYQKSLMKNKHG